MKITNAFATSIVCVLLIQAGTFAEIKGRIAALQTTAHWGAGNLVEIAMPAKQKEVLVNNSCVGPCYSPDGDKLAYFRNSNIHIVDRKTKKTTDTGIKTGVGAGKLGASALHWLRLNNEMGKGDYFYWVTSRNGGGVFRCKVGTTNVENLFKGAYIMGGVSADGKRATGTLPWTVYKIDLVSKKATRVISGCNTSMSPSGTYMLYNMDRSKYGNEHVNCMVKEWQSLKEVKVIKHDCTADNHRWSHHDEDILLWRNFYEQEERKCTPEMAERTGIIHNWKTDERVRLGSYVPYDFFPGDGAAATQKTGEPVFSPSKGTFKDSAEIKITCPTSGSKVLYTVDGSVPSANHGIEISCGGTVVIDLEPEKEITLKAIALKDGMAPSIIAESTYRGASLVDPITVTSPNGSEMYKVGDTLHIQWKFGPAHTSAGVGMNLSFDGGVTWKEILDKSLVPSDKGWLDFAWVITPELHGISTVSDKVLVMVQEYGEEDIFDISDAPFEIAGQMSVSKSQPAYQLESRAYVHVYDIRGRRMISRAASKKYADSGARAAGVRIISISGKTAAGIKTLSRLSRKP